MQRQLHFHIQIADHPQGLNADSRKHHSGMTAHIPCVSPECTGSFLLFLNRTGYGSCILQHLQWLRMVLVKSEAVQSVLLY